MNETLMQEKLPKSENEMSQPVTPPLKPVAMPMRTVQREARREDRSTMEAVLMRIAVGGSSDRSDQELAERAISGDTRAYEQLVVRYQRLVYHVLWSRGGDPQEIEDMAQETFMRAWERLHTFDPAQPFKAWIARVAANLAIDHYRARSRRPVLVELPDEETAAPPGRRCRSRPGGPESGRSARAAARSAAGAAAVSRGARAALRRRSALRRDRHRARPAARIREDEDLPRARTVETAAHRRRSRDRRPSQGRENRWTRSSDDTPCAEPETLFLYSEGLLEPAQTREVADHLAACPACRERYLVEAELSVSLRALPLPEPRTGLRRRCRGPHTRGQTQPHAALVVAGRGHAGAGSGGSVVGGRRRLGHGRRRGPARLRGLPGAGAAGAGGLALVRAGMGRSRSGGRSAAGRYRRLAGLSRHLHRGRRHGRGRHEHPAVRRGPPSSDRPPMIDPSTHPCSYTP